MSARLRIVFMGSPAFAVPCLEALLGTEDVCAVVTQPDKPTGRGQKLEAPPIKQAAIAAALPVLQPRSVKGPEILAELGALQPDLIVVVAYGKILPPSILSLPRLGCVNVHASLLPRYRGAAPIQWAIIRGERETGVTLMRMDAGMDTGPMLLKRAVPIGPEVTAGELHEQLAVVGAALLGEGLEALKAGRLREVPQPADGATLAPMLTKESGHIDFSVGARAVRDLVRGCDPWPTGYALLDGAPLKLFRPKLVSGHGPPGVVMGADRDGLIVGCGAAPDAMDGAPRAVGFAELQLPGKRRMPAGALLSGRAIPSGTQLS